MRNERLALRWQGGKIFNADVLAASMLQIEEKICTISSCSTEEFRSFFNMNQFISNLHTILVQQTNTNTISVLSRWQPKLPINSHLNKRCGILIHRPNTNLSILPYTMNDPTLIHQTFPARNLHFEYIFPSCIKGTAIIYNICNLSAYIIKARTGQLVPRFVILRAVDPTMGWISLKCCNNPND